jgi:hypothetical protein
MPASITITRFNQADVRWLIKQMKNLDKEIFNEMRREFRSAVRPTSRKLAANIPTISQIGMSGVRPTAPFARQGVDDRAPWVYKKPSATIDVGLRNRGMRRGRQKSEPVLRILFSDKRPYSLFSVLERARSGRLADQIASRYPAGAKGRWVIDQFYSEQGQLFDEARKILVKFAKRFSLTLAYKFNDFNRS